jgi:hypothetical protein
MLKNIDILNNLCVFIFKCSASYVNVVIEINMDDQKCMKGSSFFNMDTNRMPLFFIPRNI